MPNKSLKASFYKAVTNVKIRANLSAAKPHVTGISLLCENCESAFNSPRLQRRYLEDKKS